MGKIDMNETVLTLKDQYSTINLEQWNIYYYVYIFLKIMVLISVMYHAFNYKCFWMYVLIVTLYKYAPTLVLEKIIIREYGDWRTGKMGPLKWILQVPVLICISLFNS